jgi:8-oxo-dGTP pyrophosphatase MutT (NUDIX family)
MSIPIRKRGVVAVVARGEKLLVIRRSQHVRAPGMHCFPGGAIEEGESEAQAVVREMQEELGAAGVAVRPLWRFVTSWGVDLAWWLVTLPDDAALVHNPLEVEEFYWLTPTEIGALPQLLESNLQFLNALAAGEFVIEGLIWQPEAQARDSLTEGEQ